ncbi:Lrp/AsnC family transcriptional regulator [Mycolicibacterium sp. YH-1]|uniref:Lrp/AsnC family transcriptional regulator n=1 Tax=Mycolicibacterium sp. YH-1 TaxID=2908837 RepID=UPI001F4BFCCE|nr:AsnC family transcriptional regulator [Mycolicibacterium sp. YH-1]UNB54572.1 AsnC family transcriptional regulator [Mycolicibacterium sp. YH-1]
MEIDPLGTHMIRLLKRDGRASMAEVSTELGVPRARAQKVFNRLVASRQVRFSTVIAPNVDDPSVRAHISIWAVGKVHPVIDVLRINPAVRFLSTIAGLHSVIVECVATNHAVLQDLLSEIRSAQGVEAVNTLIYEHVHVIASAPVADHKVVFDLDDIDRRLLIALDDDGRKTYRDLGGIVDLSASAVMKRVHRMIASGIVRVAAVPRRDEQAGTQTVTMGVGINVRGNPNHTARALLSLPSLEFAATTIGRYDLLLTISSGSLAELRQQLDEIHARAEVASIETWVHLQILREEYGLNADQLNKIHPSRHL